MDIPGLQGLISKAPELGALLVLVFMFLKHLNTLSRDHHESMLARDEFIKLLHEDHLQARAASRSALEANAMATLENTRALRDSQIAFKELSTLIHKEVATPTNQETL